MTDKEKLNRMAKELFPDMRLDFRLHLSHTNIFFGTIKIANLVHIKETEINKNVLKNRIKTALIELKNLIQNDLDKLEKSDE